MNFAATLPVLVSFAYAQLMPVDGPVAETQASPIGSGQAAQLVSVEVTPAKISSGGTSKGIVRLSATSSTATSVLLSSSSDTVLVPSQVIVPAGSKSATFNIFADPEAPNQIASIGALRGKVIKKTSLQVVALQVVSITLDKPSVKGGLSLSGKVTLASPPISASGRVALKSRSPYASVPGTLIIPTGSATAGFVVETKPVLTTTKATIAASTGTSSKSTTFQILP
jgi:hypothetical protein